MGSARGEFNAPANSWGASKKGMNRGGFTMSSFRKIVVAFLLAASAAIIAGGLLAEETAPPAPPQAPNLTVTKTPLGIWWDKHVFIAPNPHQSYCSPDYRHMASVLPTDQGECVTMDGVEGRFYEKILVPRFSADSKHLAYIAESNGKSFLVKDTVEGKKYELCGRFVFYSPDSTRLAYTAMSVTSAETTEWCVVVNGVEGKPYPAVGWPVFSPDSKHVAYFSGEKLVKNPNGFQDGPIQPPTYEEEMNFEIQPTRNGFLVVDDREVRRYEKTTGFTFSPDSAHWACAIYSENKWLVVKDGVDGAAYDAIIGSPVFSPDSKHLAYIARAEGKQFIVMDGLEGKKYEIIEFTTMEPFAGNPIHPMLRDIIPVFSPDSQHVAYMAQEEDQYFMVQDGVEGKKYVWLISRPLFSPDSQHIAYSASDVRNGALVVHDGVEGTEYMSVASLTFSPDSASLAYAANTGDGWCVVLNGVEGKKYKKLVLGDSAADEPHNLYASRIFFSPDSKHLAYKANVGLMQNAVVLDGVEGKPYYILSNVTFSPDSKHAAYTAGIRIKGHGFQFFYVVDGQEADSRHAKAIAPLTWDSPTKCHGILGGDAAFLIEIEIAP
jgi:Tol biopolymer transport system component